MLERWGIRIGFVWIVLALAWPARAATTEEEEGFRPIFNGKDLTGWDGDPRLWSVRDGVIHGETTTETTTPHNTFLIWREGTLGDFELRLSFRILRGNSGVQVRSEEFGKWRVRGYQAEVAPSREAMGLFYDEAKRGVLATAGQRVRILPNGEKKVEEQFAEPAKVQRYYKERDWNEYAIVARRHRLVQRINGVKFAEVIDEHKSQRATSGILALQLHTGPPCLVEFKNIRLKTEKKGKTVELFNGKDLTGWQIPEHGFYDGHGQIKAEDGQIIIGQGMPMSGIGWKGEFPHENYEVELEGRRVDGYDFFCGMTFPVGDSHVTLICGGWGGMVTGLSNIDGYNASENISSTGMEYEDKRWYNIRVRVTPERITVWIDEEKTIDVARKGHEFSVWSTQMPIKPFGISTYETTGALRNITLTYLEP